MAIVVMQAGRERILAAALTGGIDIACTYKWYESNTTPGFDNTLGNYTVLDGGVVSQITVSGGDWGTPTSDNAVASIETDEQIATVAGSCTVYGYIVVDTDNALLWAERLSSSLTFTSSGGTITFTPKLQLTTPLS